MIWFWIESESDYIKVVSFAWNQNSDILKVGPIELVDCVMYKREESSLTQGWQETLNIVNLHREAHHTHTLHNTKSDLHKTTDHK